MVRANRQFASPRQKEKQGGLGLVLGIAGEQLIRSNGADDFMLAGTNILDFAAREDKDPTDSA